MFKVTVGTNGTAPTRGSDDSAGWDLYAAEDFTVVAGDTKQAISTDIHVALPPGTYGRIAPRSGLAYKHGVDVLAGVIDNDYRGEIKVILAIASGEFKVNKGDRIAQMILEKYDSTELTVVDTLDETARGAGGFGSTGI